MRQGVRFDLGVIKMSLRDSTNKNKSKWPLSTNITVNWGDMDALGHVNHSVYATWMETARMLYFTRVGMMDLYHSSNIGPILARIEIDYNFPIVAPDVVDVKVSVTRIGNSSFDMGYQISSQGNDGKVAATGNVSGVLIEYSSGKPTPIPQEIRNSILNFEAVSEDS